MIRKLAQLEQHLIWSRRGDSLYEPFLHYLQQIYVAPSGTSSPRWPESGGWISRSYLRSNPEFVHKVVFKRCWRQIRDQSDPMIETFARDGIEYTVDLRQRISYWLYAMGQFGRYVIDAMRAHLRPGDIVFDIGANTGSTTLPLARAVSGAGRIYSFEPNPGAFDLLSANVAANGFDDRVLLNNFALGDSDETMTLRVPEFNDGAASLLESWKSIGGRTKVEVEIKSFPEYWKSVGFPRPRLVKIDVEGYEPVLLAAMTDFLRDVHPILVVEVTPSVPGYGEMFETLEALKYTVMEINPNGRLDPVDVRKAKQFDVICLPR